MAEHDVGVTRRFELVLVTPRIDRQLLQQRLAFGGLLRQVRQRGWQLVFVGGHVGRHRSLDRFDHLAGFLALGKFAFSDAHNGRLLNQVRNKLRRDHQVTVVGVRIGVFAFGRFVTTEASSDFVALTGHELTKSQRVAHATLGLEQQVALVAKQLAAAAQEVALLLQLLAEDLRLKAIGALEAGSQTRWFRPHPDDLDRTKRRADLVGTLFVRLFLLDIKAREFELVLGVLTDDQLLTRNDLALPLVNRVVVERHLLDVERLRFEQVGLDPICKLRRQRASELGLVDALLLRQAAVVGALLAFDLLTDDQICEHVAGAVLELETLAAALGLDACGERINQVVLGVTALGVTDDRVLLETDQHRGSLAHLITGVRRVVAVRRDRPDAIAAALDDECVDAARLGTERGQLQFGDGIAIGELREELFALVIEQVQAGFARLHREGQQRQQCSRAERGSGLGELVHHLPP